MYRGHDDREPTEEERDQACEEEKLQRAIEKPARDELEAIVARCKEEVLRLNHANEEAALTAMVRALKHELGRAIYRRMQAEGRLP